MAVVEAKELTIRKAVEVSGFSEDDKSTKRYPPLTEDDLNRSVHQVLTGQKGPAPVHLDLASLSIKLPSPRKLPPLRLAPANPSGPRKRIGELVDLVKDEKAGIIGI